MSFEYQSSPVRWCRLWSIGQAALKPGKCANTHGIATWLCARWGWPAVDDLGRWRGCLVALSVENSENENGNGDGNDCNDCLCRRVVYYEVLDCAISKKR